MDTQYEIRIYSDSQFLLSFIFARYDSRDTRYEFKLDIENICDII